MHITATGGNLVKRIKRLLEKSRFRRDEGCFVAEGVRMVCETLPDRVEALFISEEIAKEAEDANHPLHKLTEQLSADSVHTVSAEVMKDISDTVTPQGVLAIVRMKRSSLDDILCMENPLILVLCDLQDPDRYEPSL